MSTKIGLISDVHAAAAPLSDALSVFRQQGVDFIFCAGDIAGYGNGLSQTVELLKKSECKVILGNHDVWLLNSPVDDETKQVEAFLKELPMQLELTVEGKRLYGVHASPPSSLMKGIILLDINGNIMSDQKELWTNLLEKFAYDVLVVGHTHQVFAEQLGKTLVINPGSTKFNHTCAILRLPDMEIQIFPLSNRTPLTVWNWGMYRKMH